MHQLVTAFSELVAHASGCHVLVGPPVETSAPEDTVVVWPWRMEEETTLNSLEPTRGQYKIPEIPPLKVQCMVLSKSLLTLESIRQAIHGTPVIVAPGMHVHVLPSVLTNETLLSLFLAAKVSPALCLTYFLRKAPLPS